MCLLATSGKTEVSQLDVATAVQEDVVRFNITSAAQLA